MSPSQETISYFLFPVPSYYAYMPQKTIYMMYALVQIIHVRVRAPEYQFWVAHPRIEFFYIRVIPFRNP